MYLTLATEVFSLKKMLVRSYAFHKLMTSIFKYMTVLYMQTTLSLPDEES